MGNLFTLEWGCGPNLISHEHNRLALEIHLVRTFWGQGYIEISSRSFDLSDLFDIAKT